MHRKRSATANGVRSGPLLCPSLGDDSGSRRRMTYLGLEADSEVQCPREGLGDLPCEPELRGVFG
jgi:hypothetical protein